MSKQIESLVNMSNWHGGFPGEHEFSSLESMERGDRGEFDQLDSFVDAANSIAERWDGSKFAAAFLYGKPGTGKTHAAIGLARKMADSGARVHYRYVPQVSIAQTGWSGVASQYEGYLPFSVPHDSKGKHEKRVLILDDYDPTRQEAVASAFDAAAQYAGFVIVTSNYEDPFKLVETREDAPASEVDIIARDIATHLDPAATEQLANSRREKLVAVSDRLRSRIAGGMRSFFFDAPDHRQSHNFWNQLDS